MRFFHTYGFEAIALRYFNVFGPRQDPESAYAAVIPRFISALQMGQTPEIYGDGLQSRDFTYVSNVVEANLRAADASSEAAGNVFNIACGQQFTVLEILQGLAGLMGKPCRPTFLPTRTGDVRHSKADITSACDLLGYQPTIYFNEGLVKTVAAYQNREIGGVS